MSFIDDFVSDENKVDKMARYSGPRGGTFDFRTLQPGDYFDVKFKKIEKIRNDKTIKFNEKGAWSAIGNILTVSGKEYKSLEMNFWLSDNIRNSMAAELRKKKMPLTEQVILSNQWRIFVTQNKNAQKIYGAILVESDTQAPTGSTDRYPAGTSAENLFEGLI